ncbi:MAG: glycoside hydrolase [Acidobacteriia bacterium]|nr:glycoside hydrolase [Terriglobia bacterium]
MRRLSLLLSASLMLLAWLSVAFAQPFNPNLYSEMRWRMIGPFRGGRTVAVSGVPDQPNVFYMAPNNGGVWKSTDYGHVWKPIFDDQATGSIGALAVAPSDSKIIYVGSGEGLQRPDLSVGDGIYKSTDGGNTWQHLGLREGQQIAAILVDPRDSKRLFVAVLGHPYGPNEERGVYRSTDGGESFQQVLYKDENSGAVDLAFDPSNPETVYAVLWAGRQGPWEYNNAYHGPNSGLFKSTDGGATWRALTKDLPTYAEGLGRIGIGIAPSDPNRIYALVEASPRVGGLYRSEDAGESWQRVHNESRVWGRGDDFAEVKVDPKNKDIVYCANTSTYRSIDGGKTFLAFKGAPGGDDYHRIWINPENPQVIFLGADQGATLSVNGGETWSSWYNQPTAQMFHVTADNRFPYWLYGGQQESGSAGVASRSDYGEISFRDWHPVGVEEYGYAAPDPLHPGVIYGGKVTRYDEKTGQVQNVGPVALRNGKYRFDRTAPILFSPVDPHVLYFAANVLFKTINGGHSWEIISPDLTRKAPGIPPSIGIYEKEAARAEHRGVIYSIGPSPRDVNLIWIGTDDGLIQLTRDSGKTWKDVTPADLKPWSKVTQIDAGHFNPLTAYASVSRFRLDDMHPYIYRTHDGGKTWQKITNGLPDDPVDVVREDPERKGLLFAGTERQVYVSFDDGDHWQSLRLNMPATSIRDLVIHNDDVAVATHGRSFWILDDITPLRQINMQIADSPAYLFKPRTAYRVRWNQNTDTPLPPEEPAGQNPPDGAILNYYLNSKAAEPVTIEILDHAGKRVRRFSSVDKPEVTKEELDKELHVPTHWVRMPEIHSAEAGMHRFVWDLHYPPVSSLRHEYPISAIDKNTPREPRGPLALPGTYTVRLTAGGKTYTQPLTLKMDPRISTPAAGLEQQFKLAAQIAEAMEQDYKALQEVKKIRAQLKELREHPGTEKLADAIAALDKRAAALEGGSREFDGPGTGGEGEDNLTRLNGELGTMFEIIDGADATPTTQAVASVADLQKTLTTLLARWKELQTKDVTLLHEQLKKANLPGPMPE